MDHENDKEIAGLLDRTVQTAPQPFEQTWEQSFSRALLEADTALKVKLRTELILAGALTVASTIGIGLLLRFAELFARQPLWQLVR